MSGLKKKKHQHVLIIGNGFDLDLGLPTKYSDFINSSYFSELCLKDNILANHLREVHDVKNWIDVEEELKSYSKKTIHSNIFLQEYKELCASLLSYIKSIKYDSLNIESTAYKLISILLNKDVLIIDFNYTSTLQELLKIFVNEPTTEQQNIEHIKIHGGIVENNIIFGVEDSADIKKEHIFIKKSANKIFKPINFSYTLESCDQLIVFGHSLGETDHMYFKDYFNNATTYRSTPRVGLEKQNIVLFHYDEENYYKLLSELDTLTYRNLKKLKEINIFEMIEVKKQKDYC